MAPKGAKVSDHHDVPLQMLKKNPKAAASLGQGSGSASADPRASEAVRPPNAPTNVQGEARAQVGDGVEGAQPIDQSIFAPQFASPPPPPPVATTDVYSGHAALMHPAKADAAQSAVALLEAAELDEQLGLNAAPTNPVDWSSAVASAAAAAPTIMHIQVIDGVHPVPSGDRWYVAGSDLGHSLHTKPQASRVLAGARGASLLHGGGPQGVDPLEAVGHRHLAVCLVQGLRRVQWPVA